MTQDENDYQNIDDIRAAQKDGEGVEEHGLEERVDILSMSERDSDINHNMKIDIDTEQGRVFNEWVNDFVNRYEKPSDSLPIAQQIQMADELNYISMNIPKGLEEMTTVEVEKHAKKIEGRMKWMNRANKVPGVDLYKTIGKRFLQKLRTAEGVFRDQMERSEYKLMGKKADNPHAKFYADVKENLPDYIQSNGNFQQLLSMVGEKGLAVTDGLKTVTRKIGNDVRMLSDFDDLLESWIVTYDKGVEEKQGEINEYVAKLQDDPNNKSLLEQRNELRKVISQYEMERGELVDKRYRVQGEMEKLDQEYQRNQVKLDQYEITLNTSRSAASNLAWKINEMEIYFDQKSEIQSAKDQVKALDDAYELLNQATLIAGTMGVVYSNSIKELAIKGQEHSEQGPRYGNPDTIAQKDEMTLNYATKINDIKSRHREPMNRT